MENLYELLEEAAHKVPTKGIVIVNILQMQTPALHPTDTVTTIHGPMKGFGNHITKL